MQKQAFFACFISELLIVTRLHNTMFFQLHYFCSLEFLSSPFSSIVHFLFRLYSVKCVIDSSIPFAINYSLGFRQAGKT